MGDVCSDRSHCNAERSVRIAHTQDGTFSRTHALMQTSQFRVINIFNLAGLRTARIPLGKLGKWAQNDAQSVRRDLGKGSLILRLQITSS